MCSVRLVKVVDGTMARGLAVTLAGVITAFAEAASSPAACAGARLRLIQPASLPDT
jgi:hypothetical protein